MSTAAPSRPARRAERRVSDGRSNAAGRAGRAGAGVRRGWVRMGGASQLFTAPIMAPWAKYFWVKGSAASSGKVDTTIIPYFMSSAMRWDSA